MRPLVAAAAFCIACVSTHAGAQTSEPDGNREQRDSEMRAHRIQQEAAERRREEHAIRDACVKTTAYQLFYAQERVVDEVERLKAARQILEHEHRVAAVSGTEDLAVEHDAGVEIVNAEDDLKQDWADYQRLGGKATSAATVRHTLKDPCPEGPGTP